MHPHRYAKTAACRLGNASVTKTFVQIVSVLRAVVFANTITTQTISNQSNETNCNIHFINRTGRVCLYHLADNSIYVMDSFSEKKIETLISCPSFEILVVDHSVNESVDAMRLFKLERLNQPNHFSMHLDEVLLEVYEDTNIWLTNEQREQLKRLRHGIS